MFKFGRSQNFLLIVNASHVARSGLFPDRYRDDITEAIKMHGITGARVLVLREFLGGMVAIYGRVAK